MMVTWNIHNEDDKKPLNQQITKTITPYLSLEIFSRSSFVFVHYLNTFDNYSHFIQP